MLLTISQMHLINCSHFHPLSPPSIFPWNFYFFQEVLFLLSCPMWLTCDPLSVVSAAYMGMHGSNVACIQWMRGYLLEHGQLFSSYITEENAVVSSEAISGWYSPVQGWNLRSLSCTHDGWFRMDGYMGTWWLVPYVWVFCRFIHRCPGVVRAMTTDLLWVSFGFCFVFSE